MKMSKKLIPLLMMLVMLFAFTTEAFAAEGNYVEVKSGSTTAKVTFLVENVLAFEGTVSTKDNNGFKVKSLQAQISKPNDGWKQEPRNQATDKIVLIGQNIPSNIVLTVELESDSPMKDGAYPVTLTYGATSPSGSYSANRKMTAIIYVGMEAPEEGGSSKPSTLNNNQSSAPARNESVSTEPEVEITDNGDEGSNRVDMIGMLDTAALRSVLEEAEKMKLYGELNAVELKTLQDAIDAGEEALLGDRQAVVDDAAYELASVIEALGGPVEVPAEEEEEPEKERRSGGLLLPLILAVVAVLGIAGVLMYLYMKKKMHVGYDGAPIVDYEISDDDEM